MGKNIKKNAAGYNYKYTDLPSLNSWLEAQGLDYYQYTDTADNGEDYVYTVPIINGEEQPARRGCRVVQAVLSGKSNPAQEQGSAITYARRYSLLMAFGLACTDDDAECMSVYHNEKPNEKPKAQAKPQSKPQSKSTDELHDEIKAILMQTNSDTTAFLIAVGNHFKSVVNSVDEMDEKQTSYAYQLALKKKAQVEKGANENA
jgi:hypothetical protein